MNDFGKNIKLLRSEKNMTQQQFAEAIGVTATTISAYEKGQKVPGINNAIEIAEKFDVSLDWLCRDIQKQNTIKDIGSAEKFLRALVRVFYYGISDIEFDDDAKTVAMCFQGNGIFIIFSDISKIVSLFKNGTINEEMFDVLIDSLIKKYVESPLFKKIDDKDIDIDESLPF